MNLFTFGSLCCRYVLKEFIESEREYVKRLQVAYVVS